MKDIPVIFIHEGKQNYLKKTIRLAEKYNSKVYLIGDSNNKKFLSNWIANNSLDQERYKKFTLNYKHMSTNPCQFELQCFKRYYLLYDFMRKKDFENCMMLDSDLCTYVNYSEMKFEEYDVALSVAKEQEPYIWTASPHCSYWTLKSLESFLTFFENIYEEKIEILERKWKWHKEHGITGGVCDMTLLYLWLDQSIYKYLNLARLYNNMVFNDSIGVTGGLKWEQFVNNTVFPIKKVVFISEKPWFELCGNTEKICGATIHASGVNKRYITAFVKYSNNFRDYKDADFLFALKGKIRGFLNNLKV